MELQLSYIPRRLVSICILLCIHRARRATEQQSNRALCRSRDPCSVRFSSAGQASCSYDVQRRPLPEAIITCMHVRGGPSQYRDWRLSRFQWASNRFLAMAVVAELCSGTGNSYPRIIASLRNRSMSGSDEVAVVSVHSGGRKTPYLD
jgi:hypothetical protein